MGQSDKPQGPTPREVADQLHRLRNDPETRREIIVTQQRLSRDTQPATSAGVRNTRATW